MKIDAVKRVKASKPFTVLDAVILAAVFSVVLYETVAAIKRTMNARARRSLAEAEASEEFDPNEYKRYFDE